MDDRQALIARIEALRQALNEISHETRYFRDSDIIDITENALRGDDIASLKSQGFKG